MKPPFCTQTFGASNKPKQMKAAVYTQYGRPEVVLIKDILKPSPKDNQVLVKVKATTVTAGDWRMRAGEPFAIKLYNGIRKPKRTVLGHEFAGVIEAVGKDVTRFKQGDRICGAVGSAAGAHAEYVTISESEALTSIPPQVSNEIATALPTGAMTALHFLQKAAIKPNDKVLIYGASGSVGTYAIQLAKHFGASVTAVCSTSNLKLVKSLGADEVLDYTKTDYTKDSNTFDIIFDAVGKASFSESKKVLNAQGKFLTVAMDLKLLFQSFQTSLLGGKILISDIAKQTTENLELIIRLVEEGKLKAVIDQIYDLNDIVEAHRHAQTGHKKGNLVITV
jgi:NADPH:quinone reductase-like Zn-dependent oxidoreductase